MKPNLPPVSSILTYLAGPPVLYSLYVRVYFSFNFDLTIDKGKY